MAITSYSSLQSAVANWLDRADLTARIPEFIALAEAEFSRRLRVPQMEARADAVAVANGRITLPPDMRSVRAVFIHSARRRELVGMAPLAAEGLYGNYPGEARAYAIADGQLWLYPKPTDGTMVEIIYKRSIPPLASNSSNWLLSAHPDLYLFGSLLQAEFYGWNDSRLGNIKARCDEIIDQVNLEGRKYNMGGGLRMHLPHAV